MCILCGSPIHFAVSRGELCSPAIAFDFLQFNGNTQIVGGADSATRRSLMKPPRNDTEVVPYTRRGGVRVSGGDLCIRKYAEAPTEPVGETFHARPSTDGLLHKRNGERARRGACTLRLSYCHPERSEGSPPERVSTKGDSSPDGSE